MDPQNIWTHLNNTFGIVPKTIRENVKYFKYSEEEDHFTCNLCKNKIIKIHRNNKRGTTTNFMKHIEGRVHASKAIPTTEIWRRLNSSFQNSIPKCIQQNAHVLGISEDDYFCEICEAILEVSTCPSTTKANLEKHLIAIGHKEKLTVYDENIAVLEGIYGGIIPAIFHNSQHLQLAQDGKNYFCTICKVSLNVNQRDLEGTERWFTQHMESEPHLSRSHQAGAFLKIPLLKQIFSSTPIPWYVLKNIAYLSVVSDQTEVCALYCSLCNQCFEFSRVANAKENEESLKQHIFCKDHLRNLQNRRDENDEDYLKLRDILDNFGQKALEKLDCLTTHEGDFCCKICKELIEEGTNTDELQDNIQDHLISDSHNQKSSEEEERQSELLNDLEDLFGTIPSEIADELLHLEYRGGDDFECTLCEKTIKAFRKGGYNQNHSRTLKNFTKHFESEEHEEYTKSVASWDDKLENHFESLYSPSPIPQFVWHNLQHLSYKDDNDENNFHCSLCDSEIVIDFGPKARELTTMNLQDHLLSLNHFKKLKNKAYKTYIAESWLESIFGKVPKLILNNIEHLELFEDHYRCKICDVQILTGSVAGTSEKNFQSHLLGERHQSELKILEDNYETARRELEDQFWVLPECLLKNMDFVTVLKNDNESDSDEYSNDEDDSYEDSNDGTNDEVYCEPCQVSLPLQNCLDNHTLRYHFESKGHEENVGIY